MSNDDPFEQWRAIPDHDGYELSNRGRVRSWRGWTDRPGAAPRILAIRVRHGRRVAQLGAGNIRDLDYMMHVLWGAPFDEQDRNGRAVVWRRIVISEREHAEFLELVQSLPGEIARRLTMRLRTAKRVYFHDPIQAEELRGSPCEP